MKKRIIGLFIFMFCMFGFNDIVSALDNEYGVYCQYGDSYFMYTLSHKNATANVDASDDLFFVIENSRPSDKLFSDSEEQDWLKANGVIDTNGDFACPTNPFGVSVGTSDYKECGTEGCHVVDIETPYESYSCNYVGQSSGKKIIIKYVSNTEFINGKWTVTYPDGSIKTYIGTQINGNVMPSSSCGDIYYTAKDKLIHLAHDSNEEITNDLTKANLCDTYKESEIEHFCSGSCNYKELLCPNNSYGDESSRCPRLLVPAFRFIKRILTPIIQIGIPILLILMGTIDMARAVMANDEKGISEAVSRFMRRCLAAIAVFFVVTIVTVIMNMISKTDVGSHNDWRSCWVDLD